MEKSRSRLSSVPNIDYWIESDRDSKLNVTIDSIYEPMVKQQSDISTGIFRPFRDSCKHCGNGFLVHFFVTCSCKASYCCSCVALISDCTTFLEALVYLQKHKCLTIKFPCINACFRKKKKTANIVNH